MFERPSGGVGGDPPPQRAFSPLQLFPAGNFKSSLIHETHRTMSDPPSSVIYRLSADVRYESEADLCVSFDLVLLSRLADESAYLRQSPGVLENDPAFLPQV